MNELGNIENTDPIDAGKIKATVQDSMIPPNPIDDATITATPTNLHGGSNLTSTTGTDGITEFSATATTYNVDASKSGYTTSASQGVTVEASKTSTVTFTLSPSV